jgi:hypothetical protein
MLLEVALPKGGIRHTGRVAPLSYVAVEPNWAHNDSAEDSPMSTSAILIVVGILVFLLGLAKIGSGQRGGFNLRNFGINFGSTNTQTITTGTEEREKAKSAKPDWVGLGVAVLGLATALVGLLKD